MVEKTTITAQKSLLRLPDGTYVIPFTNTSGAFEIGDIGQALFVDETKGTRRILNGQLVEINENNRPFLEYLKSLQLAHSQLFVTEEAWQNEKNNNVFGQVSKFVLNADEYTQYTYNVTEIGNLTKENGVVSGFSATNYMLIDNIPENVTSFEIVFKTNTGLNSSRKYTSVCGQETGNYTTPQITGTVPNIGAGVSADGSTWLSGNTTIELSDNTDYWFKVKWDGTNRIFSISTDGLEYTVISDIEQTAINWTTKLAIGIDYDVDDENKYWAGTIDLNESYININEERWWNGVTTSIQPATIRIPAIHNEEGYKNLINIGTSNRRILAKAYRNGTSWYNWYSDGWIEQGAYTTNKTNSQVVTFPKAFSHVPTINTTICTTRGGASYDGEIFIRALNASQFTFGSRLNDTFGWNWRACGYTSKPALADYDIKDSNSIYFIQIAREQQTTSIRNEWEQINSHTLFEYKYSYSPLSNASWLISQLQQNSKDIYPTAYEALCVELNDSVQTLETLPLPSGGKYTKHLQTVYFDKSKLIISGNPSISLNGIMTYSDTEDYVKLNVSNAISNATNYTLKLRFKFASNTIIFSTSTAVTPNCLMVRCVGDKIETNISLLNEVWDYTITTEDTFIEGEWYDLKLSFNIDKGYKFETSNNLGATYNLMWTLNDFNRLAPESTYLIFGSTYNMYGTTIDLKTIQFTYDGININCNKQENLVWNKAEHSATEAGYDKKFIVDTVNETFRLPLLVDRELNNGEDIYFYIGSTAQNSALVDVGRLTEQIAILKAEVEKLKG